MTNNLFMSQYNKIDLNKINEKPSNYIYFEYDKLING